MAAVFGRVLRALLLFGMALFLFGCDEATKSLAKVSLERGGTYDVVSGALSFKYVENKDIAFNAFERLGLAHSPMILAALAAVAMTGAIVMGLRSHAWTVRVALGLVVGGALGNLVDRLARGYVVDFIQIHGWPVFNVADIAVCLGAALLVVARLRPRPPAPTDAPNATS